MGLTNVSWKLRSISQSFFLKLDSNNNAMGNANSKPPKKRLSNVLTQNPIAFKNTSRMFKNKDILKNTNTVFFE